MNKFYEIIIEIIFKFLELIEKYSAYLQGKGYGTSTIKKENQIINALLKKEPQLAIDIGGNIGEYSAELRRRNPNLEIHIFEPIKINIKKLNARFVNDKLIIILPFAVSKESGSNSLFSDKIGSGLGSMYKRKLDHFNIDFKKIEKIKTIRFEDYWKDSLNKRAIDIIKMDIEGEELNALKGLGKAINKTKLIQFEFGGCNINSKTYFQDFWYFFKKHNFNIYRISPFGARRVKSYKESDEFFSTTNFIAVKNPNSPKTTKYPKNQKN